MIQIDDAGSGSFIGGTCIGFYRPETNEYYFEIIPVILYNIENFESKRYLEEVVNISIRAFKILDVPKKEVIEICRGYMFEHLKHWLDDNSYCWYRTQITGRAQEIVEKNYEIYSTYLGLPKAYIKYTQYPFHFHKLLRWVFADYDSRITLCKTGWKSWQKLDGIKPKPVFELSRFTNLFCLKCGKYIDFGAKVVSLSYISNRENYVYLHESCYGPYN